MKIYLNNAEITAEVLPINNPTLDETLETFSFALESSSIKMPIAPMNSVKVVFDNDEEVYFYTTTDSVEVMSMNPLKYKHNLVCVQNTRELSKHLARNTVITQPANYERSSFYSFGFAKTFTDSSGPYYHSCGMLKQGTSPNSPIVFANHERINKMSIRLNVQAAIGTGISSTGNYTDKAFFHNNFHTLDELNDLLASTDPLTVDLSTIEIYHKHNGTNTLLATLDDVFTDDMIFNHSIDISDLIPTIEDGDEIFTLLNGQFVQSTDIANAYGEGICELFVCQVYIDCETYFYNCYDVLQLLLDRYKQSYSTTINVGGTTVEKDDIFVLPDSGETYNLLTRTIAPNFTFTQLTIYECVADVFRLFDSIFTMDSNKVLQIEYFNKRTRNVSSKQITGFASSIAEDNYTNGFVSYYQDGRVIEKYPRDDNFGTIRSERVGVPETTDHYFITPRPMKKVLKVEALLTKNNFGSDYHRVINTLAYNLSSLTIWLAGDYVVDLTPYVFEDSLWGGLSKDRLFDINDCTQIYQNNTIHYAEGDNKLVIAESYASYFNIVSSNYNSAIYCAFWRMLGRIKGQANLISGDHLGQYVADNYAPNWYDVKLRVSYIATVDGKTRIESIVKKYDGETLIDQSNGAVDLNKLGMNILGVSHKVGEPNMQLTIALSSWSNRIKPADYVDLGQDGVWIANVCSYTIFGDYIQAKVSFVKNFNALSLRTRLLREKRLSNISSYLTQKSEDIITNYIYYTTTDGSSLPSDFTYGYQATCFSNSMFVDSLKLSFTNDDSIELDYSFACMVVNSKVIYTPLTIYGAGNTINFEMSFNHPMNAGNKTTYYSSTTWAGSNKYYTQAVKYTDDNGFLDECSIYLIGNAKYSFSEDFPEITEIIYPNMQVFGIGNYKVLKQPNEIFALNYQLAFLPYDYNNDFVGSEFINDNFFVNSEQKTKKLYIWVSQFDTYQIVDKKGKGFGVEVSSIDVSMSNYVITMTITHLDSQYDEIKSWSLCDENGNILYAFNRTMKNGNVRTEKKIYFITRTSRL